MFSKCSRFLGVVLIATAAFLVTNRSVVQAQPQTSTSQFRTTQLFFEDFVSARSRNIVKNEDVVLSDTLLGTVGSDGLISVSGSGQLVTGFEFESAGGLLVPIPVPGGGQADPSPFEALLSNTPARVTFGNVTAPLTLRGSVRLGVGYRGNDPTQDLAAVWGSDVDPIPFPVTLAGTADFSPFNLLQDGSPVRFDEGIYSAVLEAGSATGTPPDSPAARVDSNITGMFPGVGSLEVVDPVLGTFICTGSVIDDTHVLTAGHCFDLNDDGVLDAGLVAGSSFHLNDGGSPSTTISIASVDIHPDFDGFSTGGANDDFAVVTLSAAVPTGTTKYAVRDTGMSSAEVIEMVGYGISGFGDVSPPGDIVAPDFSVKRSGKNEADLFVVDDEGSGLDELFLYDFDGPTGTGTLGGGTLGNATESSVRGGDSGGPAFVDFGGDRVIAGVNTFEFEISGITGPAGEFGVLGGGVLIDEVQFAWIASVATGVTRATPEPNSFTIVLPALCALGLIRRRRS